MQHLIRHYQDDHANEDLEKSLISHEIVGYYGEEWFINKERGKLGGKLLNAKWKSTLRSYLKRLVPVGPTFKSKFSNVKFGKNKNSNSQKPFQKRKDRKLNAIARKVKSIDYINSLNHQDHPTPYQIL